MRLPLVAAVALTLAFAAGCDDEDEWRVVHRDLPGALLSIWGSSATDIWTVGGDAGDGPMILHFDGDRWQQHQPGVRGDLWWVHGFAGGPIFMGGKGGLILRYADGAFETMDAPGSATVFGIWGTSPSDLWAVGGGEGGASGGFVWRYDGTEWQPADGVPDVVAAEHAVWKVWGHGPNDVWMVGTRGLMMHWDGQAITRVDAASTRPLFTVHGDGQRTYAVGGYASGVILERDGAGAWADATPEWAPQMIGVCARGDQAWAVGLDATVLRRDAEGWQHEQTALGIYDPLHAVWIDPEGGLWAVGGQVLSFPLVNGVMIRKGPKVSSELRAAEGT